MQNSPSDDTVSAESKATAGTLQKESLFVRSGDEQLHLRHIWQGETDITPTGDPILMIHGSVENGRIFYSNSDKGFGPYLARQGYDVYVADFRGRGKSKPLISEKSNWGLKEIIEQDIPEMVRFIGERRPNTKLNWVTHSWGIVNVPGPYPSNRTSPRKSTGFTSG